MEFDEPRFTLTQPGRPVFRVRADRARVSGDRERAFFEGHVEAAREGDAADAGPVTLVTDHLEVIPKQDIARTDRPVTITEPRGIIRATGLVLDNAAKTARLGSAVSGTFDSPARR